MKSDGEVWRCEEKDENGEAGMGQTGNGRREEVNNGKGMSQWGTGGVERKQKTRSILKNGREMFMSYVISYLVRLSVLRISLLAADFGSIPWRS